jgi:hypothetical protein
LTMAATVAKRGERGCAKIALFQPGIKSLLSRNWVVFSDTTSYIMSAIVE